MPSDKKHARLSAKRTGKPFLELHEWMNEDYSKNINPKRHEITSILENIKVVEKRFGSEAVQEFLYHIKEDYEENKVHRLIKLLSIIKRAILSPLIRLKNSLK